MASGTGTKKSNRWFRAGSKKTELPEFDQILDLYWGGPERRITGLTLRIIGVNAIALVILMVGILFLGQYQNNLIEAKLETFSAEVELISAAISESAIEEYQVPGNLPSQKTKTVQRLSPGQAQKMVRRLSQTMGQRIYLFDTDGKLIADSHTLTGPGGTVQIVDIGSPDDTLYTIQILKSMAGFVLKLLPDRRVLPPYPDHDSDSTTGHPNAADAINGLVSMSAWHNEDDSIFLSAAAPLYKDDVVTGAVLLTREGLDIEKDIGEVWINILKIFGITLIVTVLLSIYLSGTIARPLRKLARAAERVRTGQSKATEIPDLSDRHDEIGELSIVLRDMTEALWDRMDTIESFASDVAHELKNPLTSLRSAVETASVVKKKSDRDKLMDVIKHDVERLDRLITDISNASRLDAELSREALEEVDLKMVLTHLLDYYKDPLERKKTDSSEWSRVVKKDSINISLACNSDDDIFVWGLESRLGQVFQNLLSNALSFAPQKSHVRIKVVPAKRHIAVTVEDEGPGIPENKLESIFERFYSERLEHEAYGHHSGLGLSICDQIVTALGGDIYAENVQDEAGKVTGAQFTVILNRV